MAEELARTNAEVKEKTGELARTKAKAEDKIEQLARTKAEAKENTTELARTKAEAKEKTEELARRNAEIKEKSEEMAKREIEVKELTEELRTTWAERDALNVGREEDAASIRTLEGERTALSEQKTHMGERLRESLEAAEGNLEKLAGERERDMESNMESSPRWRRR